MLVPFVKMEGVGNDYIFVDAIRDPFPLERAPECARRWSDRHFGIGADGLVVLRAGLEAPLRMAMWNVDGSRGAMCGNGLRCLAVLAAAHGHVRGDHFVIETDAGPRTAELLDGGRVRTSMGEVRCGDEAELEVLGARLLYRLGSAGNPHFVVFVDDVERAAVGAIGAALQLLPQFSEGINVDFVAVTGPAELHQRTFERGCGETLACGTGAAVAAVAARTSGRITADTVDVHLRGGVLRVTVTGAGLVIDGPSRTVFRGDIELPE
jgi:diaminopimelate epimerase